MRCASLFAACAFVVAAPPPTAWVHDWETVQSMLYAHGGNASVLDAEQHAFLASHYKYVTFADCYGGNHAAPLTQENATLQSAAILHELNPKIKTIFYWKSDMSSQIVSCSTAGPTWARHPEWQLKDDAGKVVKNSGGFPVFDTTVATFRSFWVAHLVTLAKALAPDGKTPLLGGFFIDGCQQQNASIWPRVSPVRTAAVVAATITMVKELQTQLDALGHSQVVIWNALDDDFQLMEHTTASGGSMSDHFGALQFIDKVTGDWVPDTLQYLMFNITRSPLNAGRLIQVKSWPGPLTHPRTWVNDSQPTTDAGLRAMMAAELNISLASFLLIAEETTWFGYSWFWAMSDYIPFGLNHTCPDNFYPALSCPLGPPLGPPALVGPGAYEYERQFQSATVKVNLANRTASGVVWHTPSCAAL